MRSLFTVLNDLMQPYQNQPEQARAALNDINAIVRIAEKNDMEIDSDQAIDLQSIGLTCFSADPSPLRPHYLPLRWARQTAFKLFKAA